MAACQPISCETAKSGAVDTGAPPSNPKRGWHHPAPGSIHTPRCSVDSDGRNVKRTIAVAAEMGLNPRIVP